MNERKVFLCPLVFGCIKSKPHDFCWAWLLPPVWTKSSWNTVKTAPASTSPHSWSCDGALFLGGEQLGDVDCSGENAEHEQQGEAASHQQLPDRQSHRLRDLLTCVGCFQSPLHWPHWTGWTGCFNILILIGPMDSCPLQCLLNEKVPFFPPSFKCQTGCNIVTVILSHLLKPSSIICWVFPPLLWASSSLVYTKILWKIQLAHQQILGNLSKALQEEKKKLLVWVQMMDGRVCQCIWSVNVSI